MSLLNATLASCRCRELIEEHCLDEARTQLIALREALGELTSGTHDDKTILATMRLRDQEQQLERRLFARMRATGRIVRL